jgi:hypothetical protein
MMVIMNQEQEGGDLDPDQIHHHIEVGVLVVKETILSIRV